MGIVDHKVTFRSEDAIASIAARCWTVSQQTRPFTFDVMGFLKNVLVDKGMDAVVTTRGRKKGKLSVKFFDREFDQEDPSYVEFDPARRDNYVTLHVDRKLWQLAERGDSYACWVLAHEIGHILLHDHYANAFSSDEQTQVPFTGSKEDFAEWQAIIFAGHLLLPTHVVRKFNDATMLAAACNAPDQLVAQRLAAVRAIKKILNGPQLNDYCTSCGDFTSVTQGVCCDCERKRKKENDPTTRT
jgi:IrrE N-terminal-like domain